MHIYSNLEEPLARPAARNSNRPSIKTARTPTDKSAWGMILDNDNIMVLEMLSKMVTKMVKMVKSRNELQSLQPPSNAFIGLM